MNQQRACLTPEQLESLLHESASPDRQDRLLSHLELCDDCRRRLEKLSGDGNGMAEALARLSQPSDENPSADLLQRWKRMATNSSRHPASLRFLAPADDPRLLGKIGHYEIRRLLGEGGMGIVLKGRDPKLNRLVAIKVLKPEFAANPLSRRRFLREAQAAAAVNHPHIVTIHSVDELPPGPHGEAGLPYLVMEYVTGPSLQDRLEREGPLPVEEVYRIAEQTAAGLAAAHQQGLVHRDVKPDNVLLDAAGNVKITDFGLARAVDDVALTQSGTIAGTPQYMSPEQACGELVDHRSDLFSLGCVIFAMCTGESPFKADSTLAVLRKVCDERPRPLDELNQRVPSSLAGITSKLLDKDPRDRFASAEDAARALAERSRVSAGQARQPAAVHTEPSRAPDDVAPRDGEQIREDITNIAGALIVNGLLSIASFAIPFVLLDVLSHVPFWFALWVIIGCSLSLPMGLLMIQGGLAARRGQGLSRVRFASWLALLPWNPLLVLMWPVSVWSLSLLNREDVWQQLAKTPIRSRVPATVWAPIIGIVTIGAALGQAGLFLDHPQWNAHAGTVEQPLAVLVLSLFAAASVATIASGISCSTAGTRSACGSESRHQLARVNSWVMLACAGVFAVVVLLTPLVLSSGEARVALGLSVAGFTCSILAGALGLLADDPRRRSHALSGSMAVAIAFGILHAATGAVSAESLESMHAAWIVLLVSAAFLGLLIASAVRLSRRRPPQFRPERKRSAQDTAAATIHRGPSPMSRLGTAALLLGAALMVTALGLSLLGLVGHAVSLISGIGLRLLLFGGLFRGAAFIADVISRDRIAPQAGCDRPGTPQPPESHRSDEDPEHSAAPVTSTLPPPGSVNTTQFLNPLYWERQARRLLGADRALGQSGWTRITFWSLLLCSLMIAAAVGMLMWIWIVGRHRQDLAPIVSATLALAMIPLLLGAVSWLVRFFQGAIAGRRLAVWTALNSLLILAAAMAWVESAQKLDLLGPAGVEVLPAERLVPSARVDRGPSEIVLDVQDPEQLLWIDGEPYPIDGTGVYRVHLPPGLHTLTVQGTTAGSGESRIRIQVPTANNYFTVRDASIASSVEPGSVHVAEIPTVAARNDVAISADGTIIAVATDRLGVQCFTVPGTERNPDGIWREYTMPSLGGAAKRVAVAPNATHLAAVFASDGQWQTVVWHNTAEAGLAWREPITLRGVLDAAAIAFSPDGSYLVIAGGDVADVYQIAGQAVTHIQTVRPFDGADGTKSADFSRDADMLLLAGRSGRLVRLHCQTGRQDEAFPSRGELQAAALSPNGTRAVVAINSKLYVVDPSRSPGEENLRRLDPPSFHQINGITFLSAREVAIIGHPKVVEGTPVFSPMEIHVIDIETGQLATRLNLADRLTQVEEQTGLHTERPNPIPMKLHTLLFNDESRSLRTIFEADSRDSAAADLGVRVATVGLPEQDSAGDQLGSAED